MADLICTCPVVLSSERPAADMALSSFTLQPTTFRRLGLDQTAKCLEVTNSEVLLVHPVALSHLSTGFSSSGAVQDKGKKPAWPGEGQKPVPQGSGALGNAMQGH